MVMKKSRFNPINYKFIAATMNLMPMEKIFLHWRQLQSIKEVLQSKKTNRQGSIVSIPEMVN